MSKCTERVVSLGIFAGEKACNDGEGNRCNFLMPRTTSKWQCLLFKVHLGSDDDGEWPGTIYRAKCCLESEEEFDDE